MRNPKGSADRLPARVRIARIGFVIAAAAFVACVVIQIFFAGLSIFVDAAHWMKHTGFIHIFEFVPLLMLALGFAGRLPAAQRWQSAGLFVLIFSMYFTANISRPLPFVSALHPVIAMVIFWMSVSTLRRACRSVWQTKPAALAASRSSE